MGELPKGIYPSFTTTFNNQESYNRTRLIDLMRLELINYFGLKFDTNFINGIIRIAFNELNWIYERYSDKNKAFQNDVNYIVKYMKGVLDNNFNGLDFETIHRFVRKYKKENPVSTYNSAMKSDYDIVRINSVQDALNFGKYTNWCITQPSTAESNYKEYTKEGQQFYFCLKHGFENVPKKIGTNCPLDEYGLSMISVRVDTTGEPTLITTRWNHDNDGENNVNLNNKQQLEEIIKLPFDETFKPRINCDSWEKYQNYLDDGFKPQDICENIEKYPDGFIIISCMNKMNIVYNNDTILSKWCDTIKRMNKNIFVLDNSILYNVQTQDYQIVNKIDFVYQLNLWKVKIKDKWNFMDKSAKLLLKDYNLSKENNFNQNEVIYDEPQEHFDINNVFSKANKQKGEDIKLMNAQHILAKISGFDNWGDFLHSSEAQKEIGALKMNCYKIGIDPHIIEAADMIVSHELFADFVDDNGDVNYSDEQELEMWKHVLKELL